MSDQLNLTRDQIFAADDTPRASILVKEWGGVVYGRTMTGEERDAFDRETIRRRRKDKDHIRLRERLIILCTTDADGKAIFTADDEDRLAAKGCKATDRVWVALARLNGFADEDEDDAGN